MPEEQDKINQAILQNLRRLECLHSKLIGVKNINQLTINAALYTLTLS